MRKRGLSAVLALVLAVSMSLGGVASGISTLSVAAETTDGESEETASDDAVATEDTGTTADTSDTTGTSTEGTENTSSADSENTSDTGNTTTSADTTDTSDTTTSAGTAGTDETTTPADSSGTDSLSSSTDTEAGTDTTGTSDSAGTDDAAKSADTSDETGNSADTGDGDDSEGSDRDEVSEEKHVHAYENSWSWADDYASAEVTLTCTDEDCTEDTDGHTVTLGADDGVEITSETTAAVTDEDGEVTEAGYITYTAAVIYNEEEYTDSVVVTLGEDEAEEESACAAGEYETTTDGGIYVSLEWDEGAFTGDPEVAIKDVDSATALADVEEALEDENVTITKAYGVDITFYVDGEEEEPASAVRVSVEFNSDTASDADDIYIVHKHDGRGAVVLDESAGNVEELDVTVEESSDTVTVDLLLDEFSSIEGGEGEAAAALEDASASDTVVYIGSNYTTGTLDSNGNYILTLTSGVSNTTYYVQEGGALTIKGTGTTTGSNGTSSDEAIVFENCTFVLTGHTIQINQSGISGVGDNGESLARLGVAGNVTFKNCTITFGTENYTDGGSSTTAGYDCALYLFTGNITFDTCTITGTDWAGQGIGTFASANVTFNSCKVTTTGNKGAWSYAMYGYSYWTMNNSTLMATGEVRKTSANINCFYSGDLRMNYDALTFNNTYVEFTDNQAGGFAINNVNIHVTNSTIIVSNNLGNACNSGYWIVSNSTIEMNGNRGGHGLSCIGFEMTGSTLEILHNGYAGVYIQSKASSLTNCTVDIRCNGENLLSYTAGDTWLVNHTLTITNCTSNALKGSAWLGAVGRKGSVVTTDGSSVVAYDLNTNAVDNLKSSTTASLTDTTISLSDTNNVDISDLTNGTDYTSQLGTDEHILLLNPWMTSDYARGNGEDTSSDNDADLFDDDNNLSGDYASDYILDYKTAEIGTLTTAQLSHHIYDFDTIVETVAATTTTYGYASYACVDVCAEYTNNAEEHTWSYNCDGTYVYAPLVGLHFEANAYDDDGNDVSDTVEGMPEDQTTITFSGTAETVSDPTREGYVFAGWYTDAACTDGNEFDFGTSLNACWTVVYAKWVKAIDISVEKVWSDSDNADNIRPASVTVSLYADGAATGNTLVLSSADSWSGVFEDQVKYTDDGALIVYTVSENSVSGYTASITGGFVEAEDEDGVDYYAYTVTNSHTPGTTTTTTTSGGSSSSSSSTATEVSVVLAEEREPEVEEEIQEVLGVEREVETIAATGDDSNILFWLILMLVAGAGIGGVVLLMHPRQRMLREGNSRRRIP